MGRKQFVAFREHDDGFWAYDVALGVLLKHIIDTAPVESEHDRWLKRVLPEWYLAIEVAGSGLGLDLGAGWSAQEVDRFVGMVDLACKTLSMREAIPAEEIQSWSAFERVQDPTRGASVVDVAPVVELGRAIQALVRRELPAPPVGVCWMYGTPEGRIEIKLPPQ